MLAINRVWMAVRIASTPFRIRVHVAMIQVILNLQSSLILCTLSSTLTPHSAHALWPLASISLQREDGMSSADYVAKYPRRRALKDKVEAYWIDEPKSGSTR